jgi:adenylate cyclase
LTPPPVFLIVESTVNIRFKIIFVVLPLIVAPLVIMGLASIFTSRNGITAVATEFLRFKAQELSKYAEGQWKVLQDNNLSGRPLNPLPAA